MALRKKSVFREWIEALSTALIIVLLVRAFVLEIYVIPTSSMEKTLLPGDFILVNKLSYGARLPQTPLSLPFSHQFLPFSNELKSYLDWIKLPYFRFPGTSSIKHNDVIVFNYPLDDEFPVDHKTHYVKRCVALPGDTLFIHDAKIMINGQALSNPLELQMDYVIKAAVDESEFITELEVSDGGKTSGKGEVNLPLTTGKVAELKNDKRIISIKERVEKANVFYEYIFPYNPKLPWNLDNFGPLVMPKKGVSIKLNKENLPIYKRIIENYEGNTLELEDNEIIKINGVVRESYTFTTNYYFMMGDNRHYSSDSRFWGFVPENHIVGKASNILFSLKPDQPFLKKLRIKRFFKSL